MKRTLSVAFLAFSLVSLLSLLLVSPNTNPNFQNHNPNSHPRIRVLVADLPRFLNYGLLESYWSLSAPDSRLPSYDLEIHAPERDSSRLMPYPENPLIRQYSMEYWLHDDLETPRESRSGSIVERVYRAVDSYDVVFVPFFATLSTEIELGWGRKRGFGMKEGNEEYKRQREVVDLVKGFEAWWRSGGEGPCVRADW